MTDSSTIRKIQKKARLVGREQEIHSLLCCLEAGKNILLEGPVGVGKTHLALSIAQYLDRSTIRIDGDARYTEQKLSGWFDPPSVLKKGYEKKSFFDGPLTQAMRNGSLLFINELNRLPESVQNILLPTLDEGKIELPRIGELQAKKGFSIVATMNPREFIATTQISEALLDRFELIYLNYQSEEEEKEILRQSSIQKNSRGHSPSKNKKLIDWCIALIRRSRESPLFKRGASIRAGVSIYDIAQKMGGDWEAFTAACLLALPTRVELSDESAEMEQAIEELAKEVKKKSPP